MAFWEKLLDYFTRIDDVLRAFKDSYISNSDRIISRLDGIYEALVGAEPEPGIPLRHLPFYSEDTVILGTPIVLLINADSQQGLGAVGRSGYITNEGAGTLYIIIDDGEGKSKEIRIDAGETLGFDRADDVWFDKVTLRASGGNVDYRCSFAR